METNLPIYKCCGGYFVLDIRVELTEGGEDLIQLVKFIWMKTE
ncbi:MAG: hypothetical protein N4A45_10175 [Flavobacteriales bacterium]|jgi:hypothetical protein|nr:hypothetical protein [Flavobacteriales bacterium]